MVMVRSGYSAIASDGMRQSARVMMSLRMFPPVMLVERIRTAQSAQRQPKTGAL
jgi:hypothetical protein